MFHDTKHRAASLRQLSFLFPEHRDGVLIYFSQHTQKMQRKQYQIWCTTWVWDQLTKKQRLGPKLAGSRPGEHPKKFGTPYVFWQSLKLAISNLVHKLVFGLACQNTTFRTKIGVGLGQGSIQKKFGTPYLFLQPLKLATSNLAHNLVSGLAYQKTTIWTKIGGGLGQGSIQKRFGTPYLFLQPLKLATSNLVHNLVLGLAYQKQRFGPKLAGVWATRAQPLGGAGGPDPPQLSW